jgi:hypothetical protein
MRGLTMEDDRNLLSFSINLLFCVILQHFGVSIRDTYTNLNQKSKIFLDMNQD